MQKTVIENRYTEIECDWTGFTQALSDIKDEDWFEYAKNRDEDLTQYKWIRCYNYGCERDYHIPSALSRLKNSSLQSYYRDNGVYHWYCGECHGSGQFTLRRLVHGIASYMNDAIHPLTHCFESMYKEAGNEALTFKMQEYIDMVGKEYHRTETLSFDACNFDKRKGWCYDTEWDSDIPINRLVDGLGEFVGYMKTFHTRNTEYDYHRVGNHDIIIHSFRSGDDGIGGFNTRMLVQYRDIYYLCGMEAEGSDDRWWNSDYLNGEQFFIDVLRAYGIRYLQ